MGTRSLWLGTLGAVLLLGGCRQSAPPETPATPPAAVVLIFELPDGEVRQEITDVAAGTTLADVLRRVTDPPLTITGSGAMTFVSAIGVLGTSQGQGWTFTVDDVKADRGVGSFQLTPPTTVRWKHTQFADTVTAPETSPAESNESAAEAEPVGAGV